MCAIAIILAKHWNSDMKPFKIMQVLTKNRMTQEEMIEHEA